MGLKVLVVDDDGSFRKLLEVALELEEPVEEVRSAPGGPAAIELLDDYEPDLVFVDSVMPDMPGEEAGVKIEEAVPKARIISLSGIQHPEAAPRYEQIEKSLNTLEEVRRIVEETAAGS